MRFLTLLFTFLSFGAVSQELVLDQVTFHSTYEKEQFEDFFINKKSNYMELLIASDPAGSERLSNELRMKLKSILNDGYIKKVVKKSNAKKVKNLYEKVHKSFFDKYEAQNHFTKIIKNGSYNCVTATALYALSFEKLKIPYIIQEKPTHVYAIAYPSTDQILVESTDPIGGFISFNERSKSAFINQMTKAKLIGSQERGSKSVETLFNEYYFKDTDVNLVELIGIQYMNQGIYAMNNNKQPEALINFEKAYLFYPTEKIGSILLVTRLQSLASSNYGPKDAMTLAKLEKQKGSGITNEMILNEFQRAMYTMLSESSNTKGAEEFYTALIPALSNDSLISDISHNYFSERARLLYNQGEYSSSLEYSSQAIGLKPENQNSENLFISTLSQKLRTTSDFKVVQKQLERYSEEHRQLMQNSLFTSMLANTYLILFAQSYDFRKLKEGERYHKLFKEIFKQGMNLDQNNVGRAYSIAAVYYFRLGNKRRSLQLINEGLTIAPGNYELQTRKRMIH